MNPAGNPIKTNHFDTPHVPPHLEPCPCVLGAGDSRPCARYMRSAKSPRRSTWAPARTPETLEWKCHNGRKIENWIGFYKWNSHEYAMHIYNIYIYIHIYKYTTITCRCNIVFKRLWRQSSSIVCIFWYAKPNIPLCWLKHDKQTYAGLRLTVK